MARLRGEWGRYDENAGVMDNAISMVATVLAFALAVLFVQCSSGLPPSAAIRVCLGLAVLAALLSLRYRWLLVATGFLCGFAWAGWLAAQRLETGLAAELEGRDLMVVGVIAGLPQAIEQGVRFEFAVEQAPAMLPERISLAWYRGRRSQDDDDLHTLPQLVAGERWQLTVRLKRPHGFANPHGFDYEAWLFERNLRATGYVRQKDNRRLDRWVAKPEYLLERLRQTIRDRFDRILGDAPYHGILVALAIGDQRAIPQNQWRSFADTGITHLFSVSGLHITMVAGLAGWAVAWGWRRSRSLPLRLPVQKVAIIAGFAVGLLYSLVAGFGVPAQRTIYMLGVVALALWSSREIGASRILASALLAVLLVDPWAVLAAGFWLSFVAVGTLFYIGGGRLGPDGFLLAWGRSQWAVTIVSVPILLALFHQFSLVSPLANALAIPVVSLVVTPLALLGMMPGAEPLLWLAHGILGKLMAVVEWLALGDLAVWRQQAPSLGAVILGMAGTGWLLLPQGFPARWLGLPLLLPLFFWVEPRPANGEALIRVLDVGQGLAVHVQTATHDLLYDAGPLYSADATAGERVVVPYLHASGVDELDALVLSHRDRDHTGGAGSILAAVPVRRLVSPVSAVDIRHCRAGSSWHWDNIEFHFLHPASGENADGGNRSSCVLQIRSGHGRVLLPGDLDAAGEKDLLARYGAELRSQVLLPAHHGSRSSSTEAFVVAVQPEWAIFSVGYRNRFNHPADEIEQRYHRHRVRIRRTDRDGAITLHLAQGAITVTEYRQAYRRYWHTPR